MSKDFLLIPENRRGDVQQFNEVRQGAGYFRQKESDPNKIFWTDPTGTETDILGGTGVEGSGTANSLAKFVDTDEIGDSGVTDDGSVVTVGSAGNYALSVPGSGVSTEQFGLSAVAAGSNSLSAGNSAGRLATGGLRRTFVGTLSGEEAGTGSDQTFNGAEAGQYCEGSQNTGLGSRALLGASGNPITGAQNVAIGNNALDDLESGGSNIGIGSFAGSTITTGIRNILIGSAADVGSSGVSQTLVLASSGVANGSNRAILGSSAHVLLDFYLGRGETHTQASPGTVHLIASDAEGSSGDPGMGLSLRAGTGDGAGADGLLQLESADGDVAVEVDGLQNVQVGASAPATNATDGFLYVPATAGTPSGTPTAKAGYAPIVVDSTNNKLYFFSNAAWRDAGP